MENHGQVYMKDLKCALRYLNDYLKYTKLTQKEDDLEDFIYWYYVGNVDTRKSLSVFMFIFFGTTKCRKKNQPLVSILSITHMDERHDWGVMDHSRMCKDKLW